MHEGNGLSCKEQVRQKKEKEKKKKCKVGGMKRYVQKGEIRAERTLGKKKKKIKGGCGSRGHLVTTQSGTTIAHVETTKAAHKKQTWDRERQGGERETERENLPDAVSWPANSGLRLWNARACTWRTPRGPARARVLRRK